MLSNDFPTLDRGLVLLHHDVANAPRRRVSKMEGRDLKS